jgi:hypothetical protein
MGWMFAGTDQRGREIGYGIVATCDLQGCDEVINRGLDTVCGDMHDSDMGCARYYCSEHQHRPYVACRHQGKWAHGRTRCLLMTRRRHPALDADEEYCACHGWVGGVEQSFVDHVLAQNGWGKTEREEYLARRKAA